MFSFVAYEGLVFGGISCIPCLSSFLHGITKSSILLVNAQQLNKCWNLDYIFFLYNFFFISKFFLYNASCFYHSMYLENLDSEKEKSHNYIKQPFVPAIEDPFLIIFMAETKYIPSKRPVVLCSS